MRGAILGDEALGDQPIELGQGFTKRGRRGLPIAALDGLQHLLDGGAPAGPQGRVVSATHGVLPRTFLSGFDIGQRSLPFAYRRRVGKGRVLFEAPKTKSSRPERGSSESLLHER